MVRSASPLILAGVLPLAGLAGCAESTQTKNDRVALRTKREVAGREAQRVTAVSPDVRATSVALVRDRRATAIVVNLQSSSGKPRTDVPIAVGVRDRRGRARTLNARPRLDWFQTHVPAIAAGGRATWVFRTRRPVPAGARAFATVGALPRERLSSAAALPSVDAVREPGGDRRTARVVVRNASDIPQAALQVYGVQVVGGRYVAAGRAAVRELGPRESATVRLRLTGRPRGRTLRLQASPTIFD